METKFVGQRFVFRGKIVKVIGETDSGNVLVARNLKEEWTTFSRLQPLEGNTKGFQVFALPKAA